MDERDISPGFVRLHSLATLIRRRRELREAPYVLVLGAGASLASGASATAKLIDSVVLEQKGLQPGTASWEEKLAAFYAALESLGSEERYLVLRQHLSGAAPSSGYAHLAALAKAGYFDLILSTNFDLFLETALMDAGLRTSDFFVLINGQDGEDQIVRALRFPAPRIKIFKLHGDLNARAFAFTPSEVFQFTDRIQNALTQILSGDIVVVGHSLRDVDLNRCIRSDSGALWYANPSAPSPADFVGQAIVARGTADHVISGELARFDEFFAWLRLELFLPVSSDATDPEEQRLLTNLGGCRDRKDLAGMVAALEALGRIYSRAGKKDVAELAYDRAARLLQQIGDQSGAARLLRALGKFHAGLNRPEQAIRCYTRSRDLSQKANDARGLAESLAMIGQWWRAAGKLEKAIQYWNESLKVHEGLPDSEMARVRQWLEAATKGKNS
jgi:tetratricopeptide (TPR) repeat protein